MKKTYEEVYEELKQKLIKEKDGEYYLDVGGEIIP